MPSSEASHDSGHRTRLGAALVATPMTSDREDRSCRVWLARALAVLGWLDDQTGPSYAFDFVYLIPVLAAAWLHGQIVGLVVAVGASVAWFAFDPAAALSMPVTAALWNAVSRSFLFCAGAVVLARLRRDRALLVENDAQRARFLRVIERELPRPAGSLSLTLDRLQREGVLRGPALQELRRDSERMQFLAPTSWHLTSQSSLCDLRSRPSTSRLVAELARSVPINANSSHQEGHPHGQRRRRARRAGVDGDA